MFVPPAMIKQIYMIMTTIVVDMSDIYECISKL